MTNTEHFYTWQDPFYPFKREKVTAIPTRLHHEDLCVHTKIEKGLFELIIIPPKTELSKVNPVLF